MKILIKTGKHKIEAELFSNNTGQRIYEALPLKGTVNTWGDEIYFEVPVHVELDDSAKEVVELGDLGFWPAGNCFCIFFGKTPASKGDEIRPASAVNVFGKITDNLEILKKFVDGDKIIVKNAYR
ncbi:MAG: cyclophilin-like fold protein [Nanoarchaeota archaeon]